MWTREDRDNLSLSIVCFAIVAFTFSPILAGAMLWGAVKLDRRLAPENRVPKALAGK